MWNRPKDQIELILIRHGVTAENQEQRYLGRTDSGLCEIGKKDLEYRVRQHIFPEVRKVYASPMRRCLESAKIIYPQNSIQIIDEFREMDFGDFEGKNYKELQKNIEYQRWIDSNGILPFPNGESRESFVYRSKAGYLKVIEELKREAILGKTGIVIHGGTIMAILSSFYGGEYFDYQVKNGQGYHCICEKDSGKILQIYKIE